MKDTAIYKCATCALYGVQQEGVCSIWRAYRQPEDSCSEHKYNIEHCDICGGPILGPQILVPAFLSETEYGGPYNIVCPGCLEFLNMCQTCTKVHHCEFETNPDPTPKTIRQQIQEGPMTIVTDIRNPERIRMFCEKCECYGGEENGCLRQTIQTCENYHMNIVTKNMNNVNIKED